MLFCGKKKERVSGGTIFFICENLRPTKITFVPNLCLRRLVGNSAWHASWKDWFKPRERMNLLRSTSCNFFHFILPVSIISSLSHKIHSLTSKLKQRKLKTSRNAKFCNGERSPVLFKSFYSVCSSLVSVGRPLVWVIILNLPHEPVPTRVWIVHYCP